MPPSTLPRYSVNIPGSRPAAANASVVFDNPSIPARPACIPKTSDGRGANNATIDFFVKSNRF